MCNAKNRQQCRGGIDKDHYELIVNRQSTPPQDFATGIVPEFYMKLANGNSVRSELSVAALKK
jgi:hypothetical protein